MAPGVGHLCKSRAPPIVFPDFGEVPASYDPRPRQKAHGRASLSLSTHGRLVLTPPPVPGLAWWAHNDPSAAVKVDRAEGSRCLFRPYTRMAAVCIGSGVSRRGHPELSPCPAAAQDGTLGYGVEFVGHLDARAAANSAVLDARGCLTLDFPWPRGGTASPGETAGCGNRSALSCLTRFSGTNTPRANPNPAIPSTFPPLRGGLDAFYANSVYSDAISRNFAPIGTPRIAIAPALCRRLFQPEPH